ncbi:Alpha/Beta hydrolase protein [Thamnidium elegans]|nr:Alpha/Beta hydrolase protein [Thamnidium elegans]
MAKSKFFKGVKSFLTNKSNNTNKQPDETYKKEGVAVTLTTEFNHNKTSNITLYNIDLGFTPCQAMSSSCFENRAYVHYEPKKAQVALGTNPDTKFIKMTVEQYAWIIQQLQEEQSIESIFKQISPMLGIISHNAKSLSKRFIRYVQQKRKIPVQPQCNFMLPKALILQSSSYIPMTKPLPPPVADIQYHLLSISPYQMVSEKYKAQLKRYSYLVSLCQHELLPFAEQEQVPSPPCSVHSTAVETTAIRCADCLVSTLGISTITAPPENKLFAHIKEQTIMFPVSFIQYDLFHPKNHKTASAIQPSRRIIFDSITRRQKPHAISAFQYIPPDSVSTLSQYSDIMEEEEDDEEEDEDEDISLQKYGYVAVDDKNEEIIVVFPGMTLSHSMFENVSLASVPWHEIYPEKKNSQQDVSPWVLNCALTAWQRCEMKVVTLLMRLCGTMPSHYKIVIIGYSLGGAVASLCAYSLRSTKILMDRPITVCSIHSPRVGNKAFLNSLSEQDVKTIRITHHKDLMAHLPPRTSGLLHTGDATIILPVTESDKNAGYLLENMAPDHVENMLNRTFTSKEYELISKVWDINMNDDTNCK